METVLKLWKVSHHYEHYCRCHHVLSGVLFLHAKLYQREKVLKSMLILAMPTKKLLNWLSVFLKLYQHAKIQFFQSIDSWDGAKTLSERKSVTFCNISFHGNEVWISLWKILLLVFTKNVTHEMRCFIYILKDSLQNIPNYSRGFRSLF